MKQAVEVHEDRVVLASAASSAVVFFTGATVTSWVRDGREMLFLSSTAVLDGSKAIRGGIPIAFPHFGTKEDSKLPQHGFARLSRWSWAGAELDNNDECRASFSLDQESTVAGLRWLWPHAFRLVYTVTLTAKTLKCTLNVFNTGSSPFSFTSLLHTYFATDDISNIKVTGLHGKTYDDKVLRSSGVESNELVSVASEVDRVYHNIADDAVTVLENGTKLVSVIKSNFQDVVVWNPWIEKAAGMSDFDDAGYKKMICVEVGQIGVPVVLNAGESITQEQFLG
ncbi:hypothetical protein HDU83_008658 [Entophlyctis luteolus]|nr:hypothetical protein HDU83_008658 [Entophlyctis luteolus]KAJ3390393.1 hypothetical protein HDU84_007523 [Entophlyctis sp. JEL0112]